MNQKDLDNRANHLNPNNPLYKGRANMGWKDDKAATDNRANHLNPTHPHYWRCRGQTPPERELKGSTSSSDSSRTDDSGFSWLSAIGGAISVGAAAYAAYSIVKESNQRNQGNNDRDD